MLIGQGSFYTERMKEIMAFLKSQGVPEAFREETDKLVKDTIDAWWLSTYCSPHREEQYSKKLEELMSRIDKSS